MSESDTKNETIFYAGHIGGADWKWSLRLFSDGPVTGIPASLLCINTSSGRRCLCPVTRKSTGEADREEIEADLGPLRKTVENCRMERWKVYIIIRENNGSCAEKVYRLKDPDHISAASCNEAKTKKDIFKRRLEYVRDPVASMRLAGRTVEVIPDSISGGEWILNISDVCRRHMHSLRCVGAEYRVEGSRLSLKVICPHQQGVEWKGMVLAFRYRLEADRQDYFFPAKSVTVRSGFEEVVTEISLDGLELRPIYWDVRMVFQKDGDEFWCHVTSTETNGLDSRVIDQKKGLRGLFSRQSIDLPDGLQLSIGCTDNDNTAVIVQQHTQYSGFCFRLKERMALLLYKLRKESLKKKNIILVYEKFCSMAQDNGFAFFKYCMENNMEQVMSSRIFYVIDKKQPDHIKLDGYKNNVIQFMSLKHMIYVMAAMLLVSSDSRKHAYAWRASESIVRRNFLRKNKSVFLQHGVFGLKRTNEFAHGTGGGTNLFIASNDQEKAFISENMGYRSDQIAVTGLARWDVLEDKSEGEEKKRILVMPTWRNWLEETTDEIFLESEYYLKYMKLINSQEISDYLERHDLLMDFYIHPKFNEKIEQFAAVSDRINLIPLGGEPLNELLMKCSLLVTDYSSVCWDVYYQGKPVIFYQFDLAKYNETQGAYMDLEKDLFGDRAETQEELLKLLEEAAEDGFALKPQYAEMRENMYAFIDHNNSKRICEEIMKREW